jgi:hypothetical protein
LYVAGIDEPEPGILKFDPTTQSLSLWMQLQRAKLPRAGSVGSIAAAPEAGAYAYSLHSDLSRLYIVDGWF